MTAHILVVDDDPVQRRLLKDAIASHGHVVHLAESGNAALSRIAAHRDDIRAILLDLSMPDMTGPGFLAALADMKLAIPVIVQTGEGHIEHAVEAMRAGAFDFVVKPVSAERIATALAGVLRLDQSYSQARPMRRTRSRAVTFDDIVCTSPAMVRVVELARRAAHSNIPVVLEGETGVGKEMIARAIHAGGDRSGRPFISVNCAALPADELEGIIFGRDLPDNPKQNDNGKYIEADGGTLFLREIGALPLEIQGRLLDAVQDGEVAAPGSGRRQKVNVRLISATNKDLIEEVKAGRFREDLYYRLNVFPIIIPALRRRKEDIPYLARAFAERFSAEQRLARPLVFGSGALALLTSYDWPGNTRQLETAIFRAVILSEGHEFVEQDFPQISAQLQGASDRRPGYGDAASANEAIAGLYESSARLAAGMPDLDSDKRGGKGNPMSPGGSFPENFIVSTDKSGNVRKIADIEEELIRFALRFYRGQMSQVARKLGIGRSTLYRKLKDYGIDPENPEQRAA